MAVPRGIPWDLLWRGGNWGKLYSFLPVHGLEAHSMFIFKIDKKKDTYNMLYLYGFFIIIFRTFYPWKIKTLSKYGLHKIRILDYTQHRTSYVH